MTERKRKGRRVRTPVGEVSRTKQAFRDQCDINKIVARFPEVSIEGSMSGRKPMFMDLTNPPDLQSAMDKVIQAEQAFMTLPAKVRKEFGNDPRALIAFLDNEDNYDEAVKLGLVPVPEVAPDAPAEPTGEASGTVST